MNHEVNVPKKVEIPNPRSSANKRPADFTDMDQAQLLWKELYSRMGIEVEVVTREDKRGRLRRKRKGLFARFFGWLGDLFTSWADGESKPRPLPDYGFTMEASPELELGWKIIEATDLRNLMPRPGESIEDATRRVVAEHLVKDEFKHDCIEAYGNPGEADEERVRGRMEFLLNPSHEPFWFEKSDPGKTLGPGDPMLENVRRERLKCLFGKDGLSTIEKDELQDLITRSDSVIILKEEKDGVDHPERQ